MDWASQNARNAGFRKAGKRELAMITNSGGAVARVSIESEGTYDFVKNSSTSRAVGGSAPFLVHVRAAQAFA